MKGDIEGRHAAIAAALERLEPLFPIGTVALALLYLDRNRGGLTMDARFAAIEASTRLCAEAFGSVQRREQHIARRLLGDAVASVELGCLDDPAIRRAYAWIRAIEARYMDVFP